MPLRCLIVDDRPSFSEAARVLLTDQGVAVVATAASSTEAIQRIQELRPDVALVDIDLGEESGFDLARRLAADGSAVRVILISTHDEREFKKLIESSETAGFLAKTELSAETSCGCFSRTKPEGAGYRPADERPGASTRSESRSEGRRKASTARTRRWSSSVSGRSSFRRTLCT